MLLKRCFIAANPIKEKSVSIAKHLCEVLQRFQVEIFAEKWLSDQLDEVSSFELSQTNESIDLIVSIGGDGTLLRLINNICRYNIPMLGINMGHVGFLMEIDDLHMIENSIEKILNNESYIEERMLLSVKINNENNILALNDIGLLRGQFPGCLVASAYANGQKIFTVRGDGILVSTPTGTTGYAISTGGPLISPELDCILLTPVCSHVIYQRPVVLPSSSSIKLDVHIPAGRTHQVEIDGQIVIKLDKDTTIEIIRSEIKARFVRFAPKNFIETFRKKKNEWNED